MRAWMFPAIKADTKDVSKVLEECYEFSTALVEYAESKDESDRLAIISEGLDVIQAVETVLRNHGVTYSELQDGISYVTMKNKLRGYYEPDERSPARRNQVQ